MRGWGGVFDADNKQSRIEGLKAKLSEPGFWSDQQSANKTIQELKSLKTALDAYQASSSVFNDIKELLEITDENDAISIAQLKDDVLALDARVTEMEFAMMLGGPQDKANAILSINAGAGGTESCDWANMLLRMYTRWAQAKGYKAKMADSLPGEQAGIKNATLIIEGDYAYGYLKAEEGVHRLVRISPFDANKRRHTSFASVDVAADIEDQIKIDVRQKDLRVDVFRSSGPGGQGVNTTDSAVRLTHIPTGIVVQCQNERSQIKNKATALKILHARLYQIEKKKQQKQAQSDYEAKSEIAWGSQIRSYVMHPYSMVKDHRTGCETSNVQAVMDGDLDAFIQAWLKWRVSSRHCEPRKAGRSNLF